MSKPPTHNEMISAIFAANTEAFRLEEELEKVTKERDEAIRERDEARRIACRAMSSGGWNRFFKMDPIPSEALEEANLRGWDCFKTDHIGEVTDMPSKETQ